MLMAKPGSRGLCCSICDVEASLPEYCRHPEVLPGCLLIHAWCSALVWDVERANHGAGFF